MFVVPRMATCNDWHWGALGYLMGGVTWSILGATAVALALPLQIVRLAVKFKTEEICWKEAIHCSALTMCSKLAEIQGQFHWHLTRRRESFSGHAQNQTSAP